MRNLLKVSILVFAAGLQDDGDDGHERLDHTELQSGLLTEAQEPDGVGPSFQTARSVHTAGPDGQRKVPRKSEWNSKTKRQDAQLAFAPFILDLTAVRSKDTS